MASRIALKEVKHHNQNLGQDKIKKILLKKIKEMKALAKETWKQTKASGLRVKKPKYRIIPDQDSAYDLDEYIDLLNQNDPYGLVSEY